MKNSSFGGENLIKLDFFRSRLVVEDLLMSYSVDSNGYSFVLLV